MLEPAQGLAYKTARKGVGEYTLQVKGVAAHSGVDFERGRSAIAELARQVVAVQGFTELSRGITVNVGTIEGGTRSNVIAAEARATVDVRIAKSAPRFERWLRRSECANRPARSPVLSCGRPDDRAESSGKRNSARLGRERW